jgi:peptidoglycan/xylan/chitin deacetylase (PgdA/CDA1 family)
MARRGRVKAKKKSNVSEWVTHVGIGTIIGCFILFLLFLFNFPGKNGIDIAHVISYASVSQNIAQEMEYQENAPKGQQEKEGVMLHGPRSNASIALTFDAEMTEGMKENLLSGKVTSSYDKRIIDILNQTQTKATIFLTGMWMQLYPKETQLLAQNPLIELASHSYADTAYTEDCYGLPSIPDLQDIKDIEITQELLQKVTRKWNTYFRFPGGCYSKTDLDIVQNQAKLTVVHWDVAGEDGFNENAESIAQRVIDTTQNGSIIILHLNGAPTAPKTADSLPEIIQKLKEKVLTFVTISELLN